MELHADEPAMAGKLDDLRQHPVRREPGKQKAGRLQPLLVMDVHLVAVTVTLADPICAIDLVDEAARLQDAVIRAEAHRPAKIARVAPAHQYISSEERRAGQECVSTCISRW